MKAVDEMHEYIETIRENIISIPVTTVFEREAKNKALNTLQALKKRLWELEDGDVRTNTKGGNA